MGLSIVPLINTHTHTHTNIYTAAQQFETY